MLEKIKQTASFIKDKTKLQPEFGIVLGSGLGGLVSEIDIQHAIDYSSIPNFPVSTVKGHGGKLIFGTLGGKKVIALQGRFHYYEGWTMQEVTFPIRVMKEIGIKRLFLSNAAGGMNTAYQVGDIVFITDHINLMPTNPLIGKNYEELGPRFPDMSDPYDKSLIDLAKRIADKHGFRSHLGIYAGLSGPCFETPAEYRYLRSIGADVVGMSTVPEVIVARHGGTPCFAVSIVTDLGGFDNVQKVSHEEVLAVANEAEKKMTTIIKEILFAL
jgi:purine-nucleoside phosphorylase